MLEEAVTGENRSNLKYCELRIEKLRIDIPRRWRGAPLEGTAAAKRSRHYLEEDATFFLYINKNVYFCKSKMPPFGDVLCSIIIE